MSDVEGGTWLHRGRDPHDCPVPMMEAQHGAVWRCPCGQVWRIRRRTHAAIAERTTVLGAALDSLCERIGL